MGAIPEPLPAWCANLTVAFDAVLCVALLANGDSSYRDARALQRLARERWGVPCTVLSDAAFSGATLVNTKEQLLLQLSTARRPASTLLFVLSAHGYSAVLPRSATSELDGRSEYVSVSGERVYDFELCSALLDRAPDRFRCVALLDTCHSGTLLDLDYVSFDGVAATRSLVPALNTQTTGLEWCVCLSACTDAELAGEDISEYAGWGGKLVGAFLDYAAPTPGFRPLHFYRTVRSTFAAQTVQRTHPVFGFTSDKLRNRYTEPELGRP